MKNNDRSELRLLKAENARLKRENEYLKHRLEKLSPKEVSNMPQDKELFLSSCEVEKYNGYFGYLLGRFRLSLIYRIYDKLFFSLRKIILASKIWRYLPIILSAFGVMIQFLLALGSVVLILPAAIAGSILLLIVSVFSYAEKKRKLLRLVQGKRMYLMFAPKKPRKNGVFYDSISEFSKDGPVFVITPSFSLCGFGAIKKIGENAYFMHVGFYYSFIKKAMNLSSDTVKIY